MTTSFSEFRDELLSLRGSIENLVVFRTIDSTNQAARRIVNEFLRDSGDAPEALLVAWEQTEGRGRQGRRWESTAGLGVYATLVWPLYDPQSLGTLPMLVGCGLCERLAPHLESRPQLKWPNDILVNGRKLGGILIESLSELDDPVAAIIGFGVNYGHEERQLPIESATSICIEGSAPPSMATVAMELVAGLCEELEHVGEMEYAVRRYGEHTLHEPGDRLQCRLGERTVSGEFLGFNESGYLRLETAEGEQLLAAGELIEE